MLVSKRGYRFRQIVLILSLISLILYSALYVLESMNRINWLPFGFHYKTVIGDETVAGKVYNLNHRECKKQILDKVRNQKNIKQITFITNIYSHSRWYYRFKLFDPEKATLICNGTPVKKTPHGFQRRRILLNRGFNIVKIKYTFKKGPPRKIGFFLKFFLKKKHAHGFISGQKIPFYNFTLPHSSASRIFFQITKFLDTTKPIGFLLSWGLLLLVLTGFIIKKNRPNHKVKQSQTLSVLIFEYFSLMTAILFSLLFLNNRLNIKLSQRSIWMISISIAFLNLARYLRRNIPVKMDTEKTVVLILISILVFGYLFILSGNPFPVEPTGEGDLPEHLKMIEHFNQNNQITTVDHRIIYPQTLHAFISILSDIINLQPSKWITLFLAIILVMVFFLIYLIIKHFFPDLGSIFFFLALILADFAAIFKSVFTLYYFPPLVSIFFFFTALFFFLKNRFLVSSVLIAVSLAVYPYYMIMILMTILFLFMNHLVNLNKPVSYKIVQFPLYFFLPCLFTAIYIFIYINHGFTQHQEGLLSFKKLDPFFILNPINSFGTLLGILFLFSRFKKGKHLIALVMGTAIGFLIYYIPYYFSDTISTYYLHKNIFYLTFITIIPVTIALYYINLELKQPKWFRAPEEEFPGD